MSKVKDILAKLESDKDPASVSWIFSIDRQYVLTSITPEPVTLEKPIQEIHKATMDGDVARATQLIETRTALLSELDPNGMTPLHLAAREGKEQLVALFLNKGAKVNAKYRDDGTALHLAAFNGQTAIVRLLLSKGADQSIKNAAGETPLDIAVREKQTSVIEALKGQISK